jgi:hypothetical protein
MHSENLVHLDRKIPTTKNEQAIFGIPCFDGLHPEESLQRDAKHQFSSNIDETSDDPPPAVR